MGTSLKVCYRAAQNLRIFDLILTSKFEVCPQKTSISQTSIIFKIWSSISKTLPSSSPRNLRFFEVYPQKTSISQTSIILKIWSSISKMLSSSSPRTLRFFRGSSKNLNFLGGIQKLSKQEGVGECSLKYLCLYGKCPLSFYSFCL